MNIDTDTVVLLLGGTALLLLAFSGALSRGRNNRDPRLAIIDRRLKLIMDHLGIVEPQPEMADVVAHLIQGQKIQAIKLYRERTGAGLKEAKDAVEELARQRGI